MKNKLLKARIEDMLNDCIEIGPVTIKVTKVKINKHGLRIKSIYFMKWVAIE